MNIKEAIYEKQYEKLWQEAMKLPRIEAIKKLEECAKLKAKYYKSNGRKC